MAYQLTSRVNRAKPFFPDPITLFHVITEGRRGASLCYVAPASVPVPWLRTKSPAQKPARRPALRIEFADQHVLT